MTWKLIGIVLIAVALPLLICPPVCPAGVWSYHYDSETVDVLKSDRDGSRVVVELTDEGVLFRFRQSDAVDARILGAFDGGKRDSWPMRKEADEWVFRMNLDEGEYIFRVLYSTADHEEPRSWKGDDHQASIYSRTDHYGLDVYESGLQLERNPFEHEFSTALGFDYNRVAGADLRYTLGFEHPKFRAPLIEWSQGYAFGPERWTWDASVELPLWRRGGLGIGAQGYDYAKSHDRWTVPRDENTIAAFFIKEDFHDYVWQRGWRTFLLKEKGAHTISAGYREEETSPLASSVDWALLGNEKVFRPNLFADSAMVAGTTKRFEGEIVFDTRNRRELPTRGWVARIDGEYAGHELGGDYEYERFTGELSHYMKLARDMQFDFRILGGAIDGEAPLYRRFYLGGVGTMPAYRLKEFTGNRFFLANLEYRVSLGNGVQIAFFSDIGDAWDQPLREKIDFESDMGIGIESDDGFARLNLAHKLSEDDDDVTVTFRLNRMF